jgi:hypothetical protein
MLYAYYIIYFTPKMYFYVHVCVTQARYSEVKAPILYAGGHVLDSGPGCRKHSLRSFPIFLQPLQVNSLI